MSRLTQTLPLAQKRQTWSIPSFQPSSVTQAPLIPPQVPLLRPHSTNCNRPFRIPRGLQNHYTPSRITILRHNKRIRLVNPRDCPFPNRRLLQPPTHPPRLPLSPTLPRSFPVPLRTPPPISHILRPIIRANLHRPYPRVIPATPPPLHQWAVFVYPRGRLVLIHSSHPHIHHLCQQAQPPRAVWSTFPFVVPFSSRSCPLSTSTATQRRKPVRLYRGLPFPHETSSHPVRTPLRPDMTHACRPIPDNPLCWTALGDRFEKNDILRIVRALAIFRPSLIALQMPMTDEDEVFVERCFQRSLLVRHFSHCPSRHVT